MPPSRASDHALAVARDVADGMVGEGAEAAVLVGSHARGDDDPDSDVDAPAVGPQTFSFSLERRGGLLVSISSRPPEVYLREMADPGSVCTAVPGWREALVLYDPEGMAGALNLGAAGAALRRVGGGGVTSLAEEVHKLVAAIRDGHRAVAAVQRSVLALRPAQVLGVHRRILYGSENRLWDLVADAMGEGWRRTQSTALGLNGEPFEETCRAAPMLYGLSADETRSLLDERQRRVVRRARSGVWPKAEG